MVGPVRCYPHGLYCTAKAGPGVEIQASLLMSHVSRPGAVSTQASSFINSHEGAYEPQDSLGMKLSGIANVCSMEDRQRGRTPGGTNLYKGGN